MWSTGRFFPKIDIRDDTTSISEFSLEEQFKTSRIINGKKTIGVLNVSKRTINSLIKWEVYYIDDLLWKTFNDLRSMKIGIEAIEEIESILQLHNPNFDGFK